MQRFKYAFRINVPNTVLSQLQERRHSNARLLRSSRWNSTHSKKYNDAENVHNGGQPRIRSAGLQQRRQKPSLLVAKKALQDKNFVEKSLQYRGKSSFQAKKSAKSANRAEPGTRSYAEMIATYSEAMNSKSAFATLKDSTGHAMMNKTHRSPFSPAFIVSMKPFHPVGPSLLNQEANFSTETSAIRSDYKKPCRDFGEIIGGIETGQGRVSSYATIIERYSNTVSLNIDTRGWGSSMVPRRHVSTRLNTLSLMLEDAKISDAGPQEIIECSKKSISDGLTETKNDIDAKLQPLEEQADWVDRVVSAHEKSIKDRKLANTSRRTPEVANENVASEMPAHFELKENHPQTEMSGKKPTNPIAEYIKRGPVNSNQQRAGQTPSQSSTQSPATVSNPGRAPQIELRMTPTNNESVVAINVDELSARTAGAKDELSVVISSKKNASSAMNKDAESDFGSMQISISEDTVPVKQIEFSINGKPVSELKSIVARADKLDVVSSMDKVEIRIPSKDNHARMTNHYTQHAARPAANPSAVLNLHINAKFNGPRVQQPKNAGVKPDNVPPVVRSIPPNQAPVPPRTQNIFSPTVQENAKPDGTVATNVERRPGEQSKDPAVTIEGLATASKTASSNVAEIVDKGLKESVNSPGRNNSPNSSPRDTTKIKNPKRDSAEENRVPSNMIPWWSSEEAFKKIKKKGSAAAEGSSVKAEPNKTENVVAEPKKPEVVVETKSTSPPESAVMSNPVDPPKPVEPANDAIEKSEVAGMSSELLDVGTVRVTSSQRYVNGKALKLVKQKSRLTKKMHRGRNVVKTSAKQTSDTQINSVPPPKIVKFVAVNPRTVDVEDRPEATSSDEKQLAKVEEEAKKLKGDATREGHENVQKNSDTVIKGADLERSTNRSAGVSANSASVAGESGSKPAKGNANEDMRSTIEMGPPGERVFDRTMTEIIKTMKPIEKRKDGTLIDYGVTVPSRKPSETTLRRRGKTVRPALSTSSTKNVVCGPDSVEPEIATKGGRPGQIEIVKEKMPSKETKDASNQSKIAMDEKPAGKEAAETKSATRQEIIDPVKISSVKKETLTEPKVVTSQPRIVEPVKISSVMKITAPENNAVSSQPKSDGLQRMSAMKKQTPRGPNNLPYMPRYNSEQTFSRKQSVLANKDYGKLRDSLAKGYVAKMGYEKKSADNNTVNKLATSDSKKLPDENVQNTGDNTKCLKPKDSSTSIREESSDKQETRTIFVKGSNLGSKGTTTYKPQSVAKKPRMQSCPPTTRTVDKKSEKISAENLNKHFKETGFAPFKGTITRHQPAKSDSVNFSDINEEKQVTTKKGKSESGGGSTGFGSPTVRPAGLKSPRSFMIQGPGIAMKKHERNECERPEKGLLYQSWLQRFKNSVDDNDDYKML